MSCSQGPLDCLWFGLWEVECELWGSFMNIPSLRIEKSIPAHTTINHYTSKWETIKMYTVHRPPGKKALSGAGWPLDLDWGFCRRGPGGVLTPCTHRSKRVVDSACRCSHGTLTWHLLLIVIGHPLFHWPQICSTLTIRCQFYLIIIIIIMMMIKIAHYTWQRKGMTRSWWSAWRSVSKTTLNCLCCTLELKCPQEPCSPFRIKWCVTMTWHRVCCVQLITYILRVFSFGICATPGAFRHTLMSSERSWQSLGV